MSGQKTRKVSERGQITIPKRLREKLSIDGGDEVEIRERDGKIIIERPTTRAHLAEGYRQRSEQHEALADEFDEVSSEADGLLGSVPDWDR